jgi:hypothetical protein
MRQLAIIAMVVIASYTLWTFWMTRSTTIELAPTSYQLTYTIVWGWGMDEKISVSRVRSWSEDSSEWISIWKKPYNSGASLYRSTDGNTYLIGTGYSVLRFAPALGSLSRDCDRHLALTGIGEQLLKPKAYEIEKAIDPYGQRLFTYIEPDQKSGAIPVSPPDSKYYANFKYLGKFGLVRSGGRGDEVRFVSADHAPEPRLSLGTGCGEM